MTMYDGVVDPRVREYVSVQRVVCSQGVDRPEQLVGNPATQCNIWNTPALEIPTAGSYLVLDFGRELHGGVKIISQGKEIVRIRLRFGESVSEVMAEPNQDHSIHDTELILPKMGAQEYGNTGFRFVRVDVLEGNLRLQNIQAVALYHDLEYVGQFECSDERLNRVWQTAAYTVHLNMQDYIYDGIKRDRLVWMGDLNPEVRTMLTLFTDLSLIPKSLDYVRDQTPLPQFMHGFSSYSLWWIQNQYDYYLHSGDLAYLTKQRDYLLGLLQVFAGCVGEDGSEKLTGARFLDWPTRDNPAGTHAGLQGLMLMTMISAEKLLVALGEDGTAQREIIAKLRRHVPDCGQCKPAAALQMLSGLADRSAVMEANPCAGNSTFMGLYTLLAQKNATALQVLRTYWGAMLDYGATTFWEDFDLSWVENASRIDELPQPGKADLHADFGNYCYKGLRHSLCHGWASGPAAWLMHRVLGLSVLEPGCRRMAFAPDLVDLDYAKGRYPTPLGPIEVSLERGRPSVIHAPKGVVIDGVDA